MTHRSVPAMVIAVALGLGTFVAWDRTSELSAAQAVNRPSDWKESSHGSGARPDYARLFGMDTVHEIRITISAENYRAMQEDLQTIGIGRGGGRGPGGFPPGGPGGFGPPPGGPGGFGPPPGGPGAGRGGRGPIRMTTRDPMYVPVTVQFDGSTWTSVGMRYKGNSTLMSASMSGTKKIPFRLDFDRYEDERPEIRNQRLYGFAELTFSSNAHDASMLHEVMASEVFRDRGVPAARAAFYRVFVDTGSGAEYWGLYSMVEDPSDGAMLDAQFGSHSGNLYKPDGPGATWASFDAESFEKKNNKKQADWSDVSSAIAALHAPQTDRRAWRAALEATFDVDLFLKWLAVNTAIDNWDVYGTMAHNYYLYADPAKNSQLRWIPWDNNEAFGRSGGPGRGGPRGGGGRGDVFVFGPGGPPPDGQRPGGPGGFGAPGGPGGPGAAGGPGQRFGGPGSNDDVLHARTGSQWPLIRLLLDDEVYAARYREHLRHALGGLFAPDAAAKRIRELHALIERAAIDDPTISREAFQQSVDGPGGMIEFVKRRHELVRSALEASLMR